MSAPKAMDLKNCTITLIDGSSTPNKLDLKIDEGNITWTEKREIKVKKDRGNLDYFKEGDQVPMAVKLECRFDALKSSSGDPITPHEFFTKTGAASSYKSTAGLCAADAVDIQVTVDQVCGTTVQDEIITFSQFTFEEIGGDFKTGLLSVSGICLAVRPTSVRTTLP
jgi:hypothetical protein